MTTLTELKRRKKQYLNETLSKNYLQQKLGLKPDEIKRLTPINTYGRDRYDKKYIARYLEFKQSLTEFN